MAYELTSRTGAIQERHPDLPSIIDRLSDVFTGRIVTTDSIPGPSGTAYRIWIDNDQLYGWAFPIEDLYRK